jgi:nucleoid DNA-binding protein
VDPTGSAQVAPLFGDPDFVAARGEFIKKLNARHTGDLDSLFPPGNDGTQPASFLDKKTTVAMVAQRVGMSVPKVSRIIDSFFDICYQVASSPDNNTVTLGDFGTFSSVHDPTFDIEVDAREFGDDPDDLCVVLRAKRVVRFKAGSALAAHVVN